MHEHVTNIRVTDRRDSHPTAEPAPVSNHILEGTADQRLIFDEEYNTDMCDLLVAALSNATGATITIYQYREEAKRYAPIVVKPGRLGVPPKYDINMIRRGEGFGTHYSALLSFEEEPSRDGHTPTFSPEVVKAHPRAPPRAESTRGRSSQEHVNDACKQLFPQNCRTIDALPPTRATLIQHVYQAGYYCWGQGLVAGTRRRLGRDEDPTSRLASPRAGRLDAKKQMHSSR